MFSEVFRLSISATELLSHSCSCQQKAIIALQPAEARASSHFCTEAYRHRAETCFSSTSSRGHRLPSFRHRARHFILMIYRHDMMMPLHYASHGLRPQLISCSATPAKRQLQKQASSQPRALPRTLAVSSQTHREPGTDSRFEIYHFQPLHSHITVRQFLQVLAFSSCSCAICRGMFL